MTRKLIKTLNYKLGYKVLTHEISGEEGGYGPEEEGSSSFLMRSAFTPAGLYIGNPKMARFLIIKKGIDPSTLAPLGHNEESNGGFGRTCCTGFNPEEQKWYGWSHRAIHGFGVGDVAKEGDVVTSSGWTDEYIAEHPEEDLSLPVGFEAKTLLDAQKMAIAFAEGVG